MTIRERILQQLQNDIIKITSANGYAHNAPEPFNNLRALDDASVYPVISVLLGTEESELTEYGLESTLKVYIVTRFKVDTDVNRSGLLTNEGELWFRDYERLFRRPVSSNVNINHISELWSIDEAEGGVENYYISAKEPFADDTKENIQTALIELTISLINLNS